MVFSDQQFSSFIKDAFSEDIGNGDYTTLSCIPENTIGKAKLIIKEGGVVSGVELAQMIFRYFDNALLFNCLIKDGNRVEPGEVVFNVEGSARSILTCERLVLNCMQRMSGISTLTRQYVDAINETNAKVLDTRKTTPLSRTMEKWAVRLGGGFNHRFGLYDMVMIKDNHIDFAGSIGKAINAVDDYLKKNNLVLPVEIETRNLEEVKQVLDVGKVDRIMLDNFSPRLLSEAIKIIDGKYETEASGGITLLTIRSYAETGVDFISAGALTHSFKSLDMSLKATK